MGAEILTAAFVVVVIGGMGTMYGAVVGAAMAEHPGIDKIVEAAAKINPMSTMIHLRRHTISKRAGAPAPGRAA